MTGTIVKLLANKAVRTLIIEICVGVSIGVVTNLKNKDINEKREQLLLHMRRWTSNHWKYGSKKEVRHGDPVNQVS